MQFWNELIKKYLKPLDKNKAQEAQVTQGLKELRNQMVFSFLMINSIWVIMIFLMQDNKDVLGIRWPINPTLTSLTWNLDDQIIFLEYDYLQLEPIGLIFVIWFAVILLIQLLGMITHRIMTLGHIVSSTSIVKTVKDWFKKDKDNAVDGNQVLDEHGIDMIKRWQKTAMVGHI